MKKYLLIIPFLLFPSVASAAISGTLLTAGETVAGNSTGTTASITPAANQLILLTVTARNALSQAPTHPTVTGDGLTWVQVAASDYDTGPPTEKSVVVFRAMGASPTTGGVTIDYAGQAQTDILWAISQFNGVDTSGQNGSGAIAQSTTTADQSVTTSTATVTLVNPLANTNDVMFVGGASDGAGGSLTSYGAGFTGLGTVSSTNIAGVAEEYAVNKTTGTLTWDSNHMLGMVGVELKNAVNRRKIISVD
jgi:hypothetical protein